MPQNKPVLIVANSGRALATSAAKAGIATCVIDRFADQDTCEIASIVKTADAQGSVFNNNQLLPVLTEFSDVPLSGVIIGSGLESDPEILNWIQQRWQLIGNSAEVIKRCKDPSLLFPLLDSLGIPHPEISLDSSIKGNNWLIKQTGGAGGGHISIADNISALPENYYLQKKLDGRNFSVVFLADGIDATIIGSSETFTMDPVHDNYEYSGAVSLCESELNNDEIIDTIVCLVASLHLRGLCGIDFIVDDAGKYNVLEVNPRPTATFELHENKDSLLQTHIMACEGELIREYKKISGYRGHRIIYTDTDLAIPSVNWPAWVSDRPVPGRAIRPGMPVCTIHAEGGSIDVVNSLLLSRTGIMQKLIDQYRLAA